MKMIPKENGVSFVRSLEEIRYHFKNATPSPGASPRIAPPNAQNALVQGLQAKLPDRFASTVSNLDELERDWNTFKGNSPIRSQQIPQNFTSTCGNLTTLLNKIVPTSKVDLATTAKVDFAAKLNLLDTSAESNERPPSIPKDLPQHFQNLSKKYSNIYKKPPPPPVITSSTPSDGDSDQMKKKSIFGGTTPKGYYFKQASPMNGKTNLNNESTNSRKRILSLTEERKLRFGKLATNPEIGVTRNTSNLVSEVRTRRFKDAEPAGVNVGAGHSQLHHSSVQSFVMT